MPPKQKNCSVRRTQVTKAASCADHRHREKRGILSKSIGLGPDGQPVSDSSGCFLVEGTATPVTVKDAAGLKAVIDELSPEQGLTLGVPAGVADGVSIAVFSKERLALAGTRRQPRGLNRFSPSFPASPASC